MADHVTDWLSRVNIPDMYPRRDDPFQPGASIPPATAPPASLVAEPEVSEALASITQPGSRPYAYQDAINYTISVGTTAVPLLNTTFPVDAILIDVPSTAVNGCFFGRGSISTGSGVEVRAGIPAFFRADNTRELWEVQRLLEFIAGMLAADRGIDPLPTFRARRVVFDASKYSLVATATVTVAVMLFYIPEQQ
jgi:hypothetical protein